MGSHSLETRWEGKRSAGIDGHPAGESKKRRLVALDGNLSDLLAAAYATQG